jgi:heme/copper-type cytochrome/quinol oxidase subunit 2
MRNILKNRTALSTVVTTLIILVVSVLLAGVVTYFAINVTSTRVQEENLAMTKQHIWDDQTNALGAIMITNTGGRDVVISKVAIRGQASPWTNVFYNISATAITVDIPFNKTLCDAATAPTGIFLQTIGTGYNFTAGTTNPLVLPSGQTMLMYIKSPDSISVNDIGLTVAITVFTSQAMYYKETNVEAAVS